MESMLTCDEMELLADLITQDEQTALYQPCFAVYENEARLEDLSLDPVSYLEAKYGK